MKKQIQKRNAALLRLNVATDYAEQWQKGTLKDLYYGTVDETGKPVLPSAEKRQGDLVRIISDTALETAILYELKSGKLPSAYGQGDHRYLIIPPGSEHKYDEEAQQARDTGKWVGLINEWRSRGVIRNCMQQPFLSDSSWDQKKTKSYEHAKDPRVRALRKLIHPWLDVVENGEKSFESAERKCNARKAKIVGGEIHPSKKLLDMSRITIIPQNPEIAETFFKLLEGKIAHERETAGSKQQLVLENWQLNARALYYLQNYIIFPAYTKKGEPEYGAFAEIKAVSREMMIGDYITHPIYEMSRMLEQELDNPKVPAPGTKEFTTLERKFFDQYDRCRSEFMSRLEEHHFSYPTIAKVEIKQGKKTEVSIKAPGFSEDRLKPTGDRRKFWTHLSNELETLTRLIHIQAIGRSGPDWAVHCYHNLCFDRAIRQDEAVIRPARERQIIAVLPKELDQYLKIGGTLPVSGVGDSKRDLKTLIREDAEKAAAAALRQYRLDQVRA